MLQLQTVWTTCLCFRACPEQSKNALKLMPACNSNAAKRLVLLSLGLFVEFLVLLNNMRVCMWALQGVLKVATLPDGASWIMPSPEHQECVKVSTGSWQHQLLVSRRLTALVIAARAHGALQRWLSTSASLCMRHSLVYAAGCCERQW